MFPMIFSEKVFVLLQRSVSAEIVGEEKKTQKDILQDIIKFN